MASKYAFENLFRTPWELLIAIIAFSFGSICILHHQTLALSANMGVMIAMPCFLLALIRSYQGIQIWLFKKRLLLLKSFAMSTKEVPVSKQHLYLGKGFTWLPIHRQRLHLLSMLENQSYIQRNFLYRFVQKRAKDYPKGICAKLTTLRFLPFRPMPEIGGKAWLHGVGSDKEHNIYVNQSNRNSHECTFGMTRVGKTRYLSIKVNQDIRNGDAVLIIDPKGDLEVMQDIYCATKACGRLDDLIITHFGFPDISAKYNPLASFSNVSEVASRVVSAIAGSGEGQAFKDFAWQYVNIVASCLNELGEVINYKTIAFYIKRPEILLITYVDKIFPNIEAGYLSDIQEIIDENNSRVDKDGNPVAPLSRSIAIKRYLTKYIEEHATTGTQKQLMDSIIVPLYNAATLDKTYYDKITASIGPVLDKINQTQAESIFSFENSFGLPEIKLEDIIKRKQIVYIGLDSLTNKDMAESVGQAIIADLVSLCGRIYSEAGSKTTSLCLHCDEFSNIVRDEFVNLLNKAGGAGIKVSAYTQTINDLGAAFGNNQDKAKMLMGNFGTISMLRVSNEDTAKTFTNCLETIQTRTSVPSTMANDKPDGKNGDLFTTYNTDTILQTGNAIIEINDLFSLPKGQAFVMTNGGELYKIRIPLPKNDGTAPQTFETVLSEVNLCFA
ncbi:MAG: conjugative coupling factor TraD, PFGI-1 class [Thiotrichales bacterium]|nr:MAG: conjugative coupling factor TraD, PFGI-1 class [Thiotrichales bacterium]